MSRYVIKNDGKREVKVGWDPPLATYFLQVYDLTADDDDETNRIIVWEGLAPNAITTVEALEAMVKEWAFLPWSVRGSLKNDKLNSPPPSPLQQEMLDRLAGKMG